ncbi:hypothetical protein [Pseudoalteromonas sp. MelDa3]|uniref:hypothetical protein n=1 Tax=Pseudoalteromonas sp. MelDa3 TaxID=888435 RepID=UPI000CC9D031|nr:hypothetical protein [Pseudoalteromonas sp. MelDa3]PLT26671.1 hypothetical protein CXF89_03705 [Pseudoalteromonas sp. MelDa3]
MTNIAKNQDNAQRVNESELLAKANIMTNASYDDFDRLLTQTRTLVDFMIGNDNMEGFSMEQISNLLWLVSDRLGDMQVKFESMPMRTIQ